MLALVLTFLFFLIMGTHLGIALALGGVACVYLVTGYSFDFVIQSFLFFLHKYPLMAVPFFILAGFLMERTGLIRQIFDFAESLLKFLPGGLGAAAMATCMVFAAITGSSVAMASAMAVIAIPVMRQRGYDEALASGIVCSGGTLGLLIPPSITLIVYGVITETSIVHLFMAGMVPGVVLGSLFIGVIIIIAIRRGFRPEPTELKRIGTTFVRAIGGLLFPVLVLGGLYGGVFTPTEAGAAACGYALLYGLITGRLNFAKKLPEILTSSLQLTTVVFLLVGGAGIFVKVAAIEYIPQHFAEFIIGLGLTPLTFVFAYMVVLLILGCFLDAMGMIVLTVPIIFPVAMTLGINPLHLGVLITINSELGCITPPVGLNLYAVSGLSKIPIATVLRGSLPFFLVGFAFLIFMVFTPTLALWFPHLIHPPIVWGGG
ncbi:MAG TPA: TRAP transporter large permease [Dehalococcoidia bacterium]|nr:TRAP transporter large permease [Dehalococcoidia bacterium]